MRFQFKGRERERIPFTLINTIIVLNIGFSHWMQIDHPIRLKNLKKKKEKENKVNKLTKPHEQGWSGTQKVAWKIESGYETIYSVFKKKYLLQEKK